METNMRSRSERRQSRGHWQARMRVGVVAVVLLVQVLAVTPYAARRVSAATFHPVATIPLPDSATDLEVDDLRDLAYLSSPYRDSVIVVSLQTRAIVGEIPVGSYPGRMFLDAIADRLFVGLRGNTNGVAVLDLASQSVEAVWPVGPTWDIVIGDRDRAYISPADQLYLEIVNTTNGAIVGTINQWIYNGANLAISPDHRTLYAGDVGFWPSSFYMFNITTDNASLVGEVHGSLGNDFRDVVVSPNGTWIYVCTEEDFITVVDADTLAVAGHLDTGATPFAVDVAANGSVVLGGGSNPLTNWLYTFDGSSSQKIDSFLVTEPVIRVALGMDGTTRLAYTEGGPSGPFSLKVFSTLATPIRPPIARLSYSPAAPEPFETVTFDASSSQADGDSWYLWDFGNYYQATGVTATNSYEIPGNYTVTLFLRNEAGQDSTQSVVTIAYHPVEYVVVDHPSGFRLPVPVNWSLERDQVISGRKVALFVRRNGPPRVDANVIVVTEQDAFLRETSDYLDNFVQGFMAGVRQANPNAQFSSGPTITQVAGHAAVTFAIQYNSVIQKGVVVMSEPHRRYWLLLLTTTVDYGLMRFEPIFDHMVAGFEITAPPLLTALIWPALLLIAVGVVAAVILVLFWRRRSRVHAPPQTQPHTGTPPEDAQPPSWKNEK